MSQHIRLDAGCIVILLSCAMLSRVPVAFSFHNVCLRGSYKSLEKLSGNDSILAFKSTGIPLPLSAVAKGPTPLQAAVLQKTFGSSFETAARTLQADLVPCVKRSRRLPTQQPGFRDPRERLLHVTVCGGLQQKRQGIVNAVVLAKLLNATLVVPELKVHHHWKDKSQFEDIFNLEHFVNTLHGDVPILTRQPSHSEYKAWRASSEVYLPRARVDVAWYMENTLPVLQRTGKLVLRFFYWQMPEDLPRQLQLLRCRVQFHALMFVPSVMSTAAKAIELLQSSGPYVAVHLRYEIDWLVLKECLYDNKTNQQLAEWARGKVPYHPTEEESERKWREGQCPLSPRDVGVILKALGVGPSVRVFLAGGTPFDEQKSMKPLRDMFPGQLVTKGDLLDSEDMRQLRGKADLLTAIDYMLCLHSDFFFMTVGGNMGRLLRGHRFYRGAMKESYFPSIRKVIKSLHNSPMNEALISELVFGDRLQQALKLVHDPVREKFFDKPSECVCKRDVMYDV